mmetsp:Transcript_7779/g.13995  ORF Transcript_7779/g.13995 Transcript_7779/m.13995 type:complete len:472 (+) Transcript_7779:388-1803(+)
MSIAASKLQQRRQDQDRVLRETQCFINEDHNTHIIHDWERRTQQRIEQREVDTITQKLLQQEEEELHQRKQELQSLYNDEMSQWKTTLQSSLEVTQEERMERIRTRAYKLKATREAERQNIVKECYERQWRDACDDLRAIDSKATLDRIMIDREMMIKSKRIIEEQEQQQRSQNEAHCMSLINNKDESDGQCQRRQSSLEIKRALDHQVQWKRTKAESMTKQLHHEEQEELRLLALLESQARESSKESMEKARRGGGEMLQETRLHAKEETRLRAKEREQNVILLQHALNMERRQIQVEQAKKEVGKEAASEYVQCLREEAKLDEKENAHVNRIRDAESERITKLNDDKLMAEAEMKRRWMEEVDITRQEQIRRKQIEAEVSRKEIDREVAGVKATLLRAEESDKGGAEKAQAIRMENMLANKATIDRRAKEREKEQQEKFLIQKQIQNDQRVYQKRLEAQKNRCGVSDLI